MVAITLKYNNYTPKMTIQKHCKKTLNIQSKNTIFIQINTKHFIVLNTTTKTLYIFMFSYRIMMFSN